MTETQGDRPAGDANARPSDDPSVDTGSDTPADSLNTLQVVSSVFAAGLGVQSSKNRERDFQQGRAGTFIIAGLVFTALFIGTVYSVVSMVLSSR